MISDRSLMNDDDDAPWIWKKTLVRIDTPSLESQALNQFANSH